MGPATGWACSAAHEGYGLVVSEKRIQLRAPVSHPGDRLRVAVDSVLAGLTAETKPDQLHMFDETLRGALAWTAAVGDTCQIAPAVQAVRKARLRLDAADADQARMDLLTAKDGLKIPTAKTR
jgi:hypothetical protein